MKPRAAAHLISVLLLLALTLGQVAPLYAQEGGHALFLPSLQHPLGAEGAAGAAVASNLEQVIVVMQDSVDNPGAVASELARRFNGSQGFVYENALKGAVLRVPVEAIAGIQHDPRVKFVEVDSKVELFAQEVPTGVQRIFADDNGMIDIDGADDNRVDVDVAVIDTGVDFQHPDLNVAGGVNCSGGSPFKNKCSSGGDDDHYHGTHVAGTIAALDNGYGAVGVAPGARIWAVKVLNSQGSGYTSWIVAGIDWVAANSDTIEVANMSLGGSGYSQAEYLAIQGAVTKGVAFAVSAGNSNDDANNYSPAAFDNVLSVSALADFDGALGGAGSPTCRQDQDDTLADFSNWGSAVNIAAPGVCIFSTFPLEQGEYGTISGTSMASPHVAGALALLASSNNPDDASHVDALYSLVMSTGNMNWTDDSDDGVQEPLLDVSNASFSPNLIAGSGGSGGDNPPNVSIDTPLDGANFPSGTSINFVGSATDSEDGDLTADLVWISDSDGEIGIGGSFSIELSDGKHNITASVTDSGGNSAYAEVPITVGVQGGGSGITLSATGYKVKGVKYADLTWNGNTSAVDVKRDGVIIDTSVSGSTYNDNTDQKGGGSYTYEVCETGTSTCSNIVTVIY